jgi:hypothetical protein
MRRFRRDTGTTRPRVEPEGMKHLRIVLLVIGVLFTGPAIAATVAIVTGFNCTDHPNATVCADDAD